MFAIPQAGFEIINFQGSIHYAGNRLVPCKASIFPFVLPLSKRLVNILVVRKRSVLYKKFNKEKKKVGLLDMVI